MQAEVVKDFLFATYKDEATNAIELQTVPMRGSYTIRFDDGSCAIVQLCDESTLWELQTALRAVHTSKDPGMVCGKDFCRGRAATWANVAMPALKKEQ